MSNNNHIKKSIVNESIVDTILQQAYRPLKWYNDEVIEGKMALRYSNIAKN